MRILFKKKFTEKFKDLSTSEMKQFFKLMEDLSDVTLDDLKMKSKRILLKVEGRSVPMYVFRVGSNLRIFGSIEKDEKGEFLLIISYLKR